MEEIEAEAQQQETNLYPSGVMDHSESRDGADANCLDIQHPDSHLSYSVENTRESTTGKRGKHDSIVIRYSKLVEKRPGCFLFFYVSVPVLLIVVLWHSPKVDTNFASVIKVDGESMRHQDALNLALPHKKSPTGRRLSTSNDAKISSESAHMPGAPRMLSAVILANGFTVMYEARGGNVLHPHALREIKDFEQGLRKFPLWRQLCEVRALSTLRWKCDPGVSFAAYAWPTQGLPTNTSNTTVFSLIFNARGAEPLPLPAVFAYLLQSPEAAHDLRQFLPRDYVPLPPESGLVKPATALKSHFEFPTDITSAASVGASLKNAMAQAREDYATLIKQEVYPYLRDASSKLKHVRVSYFGDVISGHEVNLTLQRDIQWAIGSVTFLLLYLLFHTRSVVVTACCLFSIVLSLPLAYVLTRASKLTIVTFVSVYLVTGIGSDVIFVFSDAWDQSASRTGPLLHKRIAWMLKHAGQNCLVTSLTTSAGFFANLASALQPLREFGMFMGLAVMAVWCIVACVLPPVLVLRERVCGRKSRKTHHENFVADGGSPVTLAVVPSPMQAPDVDKTRLSTIILCALVRKVRGCSATVVCMAVLLCLALLVVVLTSDALDTSIPEVFDDSHNQIRSKTQRKLFVTLPVQHDQGPPDRTVACSIHAPHTMECALHWCQTVSGNSQANATTWTCWHQEAKQASCSQANLHVRLASYEMPTSSIQSNIWHKLAVSISDGQVVPPQMSLSKFQSVEKLSDLVLEDWATGLARTTPYYDLGGQSLNLLNERNATNPKNTANQAEVQNSCSLEAICFRGIPSCATPGWRQFSWSEHALPRTLTAHRPRVLTDIQVPAHRALSVTVVWGLLYAHGTPLIGPPSLPWDYDQTFEPSNPWAQRAMYSMCVDVPPELKVVTRMCWIEDFRRWILAPNNLITAGRDRFPSREFDDLILSWFPLSIRADENLWVVNNKVKAAKLSFRVNVDNGLSAAAMLAYKQKWDDYVSMKNSLAAATARRSWHTTAAWVRAEAELAVVASTLQTIATAATIAWIGVLLATWDPWLASMVLLLTLAVIVGLCSSVVIIGWKIGPIEIIALIVLLGYAVTFPLHIVHSYNKESCALADSVQHSQVDDRFSPFVSGDCELRTGGASAISRGHSNQQARSSVILKAVRNVGSAVLSAAVTTFGCTVFLLFCDMTVFNRLGVIVIVTTALALCTSFVLLPATLILIGPGLQPWHQRVANCVNDLCPKMRGSHLGVRREEDLKGGIDEGLLPAGADGIVPGHAVP